MSAPPVVRLRGVGKSFASPDGPVPVLADVDLSIRAGDKASLVGPSGSGKSTLLALMAGLLRPTIGVVEIDGRSIGDLDDTARATLRARRVGIALQTNNLFPFLTAAENVEVALGFGTDTTRRGARRRALELLDRFDVAPRAGHRPRQLSGGEAQRVSLAVALANRPALLLADEVVAQLDGTTAGHVVDDVLDGDVAVLYVTHDVALADRVLRRFALRDGRLCVR